VTIAVAFFLASEFYFRHGHSAAHLAYIGPGSGFAFLSSFLTLFVGFFASVFALLTWPFRMAWRAFRQRKSLRKARVKKAIFLGLDGFDPRTAERLIAEGKLPNLKKLADSGGYCRLRTTFPALSPVAWSTFATGVNPARHNIFDFLDRSLKSYLPQLSSARVEKPKRFFHVGRLRIPRSRGHVELLRKSKPFWKILGERGIRSTVLRIPITFPPEKFDGRMLSAMSTPDLKGTQGSFSQFTTKLEQATYENGNRYPLRSTKDGFEGTIEGPQDSFIDGEPNLKIPFRLVRIGDGLQLRVQGQTCRLVRGDYTDWVKLSFRTAIGAKAAGIARFLLTEFGPECSLYMSPIQIDPERPALPISHPSYYAKYLASLFGPYATCGMAEDTWALNEGVIDESAFLDQAYSIFNERKRMFLNAVETASRGVVACVFDTSDRVQHMFYRRVGGSGAHAETIEQMYLRMDELVGETLPFVQKDTAFYVLSDHGFTSFRRGVNLNSWLLQNGYLKLKPGAQIGGSFFDGVDWTATRAYALGLGGMYLNVKGREAEGIVEPGGEAERLRREIIAGLGGLREESGEVPIRAVYAAADLYRGPYLDRAPDLIVGYNDGYRVSWESAVGKIAERVLDDNPKAWSGDHCVDPSLVPGVLFSNRAFQANDPGIEDLAPTALDLFGLEIPAWMEGKSLLA
jgi:predicted AlkP superfamily phosphohydrolase/phosphomutase